MRWTVDRVTVELLEDDDAHLFGINQTQSADTGKMAPGGFYAEIWTEDALQMIIKDLDQGLPPIGSYEPHLVQAGEIPETTLQLSASCSPGGEDERSAPEWHTLTMPETGWAGRMVQVFWKQTG